MAAERTAMTLLEGLRALIREELERHAGVGGAGDSWVDQKSSPLGRREHCRLARTGALPAFHVGRRWLIRRSVLDAYIQRHGQAPSDASPAPPAEDALLEELGFERVARDQRKRAGGTR